MQEMEKKKNRRPPGFNTVTSGSKTRIVGGPGPVGATLGRREEPKRYEEVGLVSRLHLLFGKGRSVTTALKVVEEVQEEMQEIEREWEEEEVGWNTC